MKIRNGFVSNSSSSSFVVYFPNEPKSVDDVKNIIFDNDEYYNYDEYSFLSEIIADIVWKDVCNQSKNDFERAKEMILDGNRMIPCLQQVARIVLKKRINYEMMPGFQHFFISARLTKRTHFELSE